MYIMPDGTVFASEFSFPSMQAYVAALHANLPSPTVVLVEPKRVRYDSFKAVALELMRLEAERALSDERPATPAGQHEFEQLVRNKMAERLRKLRRTAMPQLRQNLSSYKLWRGEPCDYHLAEAKALRLTTPISCRCVTPLQQFVRDKYFQLRRLKSRYKSTRAWYSVYLWMVLRDSLKEFVQAPMVNPEDAADRNPVQENGQADARYVRVFSEDEDGNSMYEDVMATDFCKPGALDLQGFDRPAPRAKRVRAESDEPYVRKEWPAQYTHHRKARVKQKDVLIKTEFYRRYGAWYWAKDDSRCHTSLEQALRLAHSLRRR